VINSPDVLKVINIWYIKGAPAIISQKIAKTTASIQKADTFFSSGVE
jgi:hypothetical protein